MAELHAAQRGVGTDGFDPWHRADLRHGQGGPQGWVKAPPFSKYSPPSRWNNNKSSGTWVKEMRRGERGNRKRL